MQWDEQSRLALPQKASRPRVLDAIVGPGRRYRHPAVQAEIERRVAIYAEQVARTGMIKWLPFRGQGISA